MALVFLKYDPDQPRAPKGTEEGGQWISEGESSLPRPPTEGGRRATNDWQTKLVTDGVLDEQAAAFVQERRWANAEKLAWGESHGAVEMLVAINEDGSKFGDKLGESHQVTFTHAELYHVETGLAHAYASFHNHPGTGGSFSDNDVDLFVRGTGWQVMVVSSKEKRYFLAKPSGWRVPDWVNDSVAIEAVWEGYAEPSSVTMYEEIGVGVPPPTAVQRHTERVASDLAKELGLVYWSQTREDFDE